MIAMSKVGYERVSTTGQNLEVQQSKLTNAGCDRI
jgi:DNA invertase Pin-like site-specific DNA recombinase